LQKSENFVHLKLNFLSDVIGLVHDTSDIRASEKNSRTPDLKHGQYTGVMAVQLQLTALTQELRLSNDCAHESNDCVYEANILYPRRFTKAKRFEGEIETGLY
jgi:hypothetical protein